MDSESATTEATAIERAIGAALASGYRTVDLVRVPGRDPVGSKAMAAAIIERIAA